VSEFRYGAEMERVVAEVLRAKGWSVALSNGSRGPYDLTAVKRRRTWLVQVKATRRPVTFIEKLPSGERIDLVLTADQKRATPVLALVAKRWVFFLSARSWRHLHP
jgi:Holliday junction resolvase